MPLDAISREVQGSPINLGLLIDGNLIGSDRRIDVTNPARPHEVVGTIVAATRLHATSAIEAAHLASKPWARRTATARADLLARGLDDVENAVDRLAPLFVMENGKILSAAKSEFGAAIARERRTLALAEQIEAPISGEGPRGRYLMVRRPFGVVVSIIPWNGPIVLGFTQIFAALLAGNAVVVKPATSCPLALMSAIELIAAHLPPGVLNVVTGQRGEVGDVLTTHPLVGKVAFTGSTEAGREIMVAAADTIKHLTLELGGNDPAIILDDAVLSPPMVERLVNASFRNAGQVCMAVKRIYVHRSLADKFSQMFVECAQRLRIGDGLDPDADIGPVHSAGSKARVAQIVADAVARGGIVLPVGMMLDSARADGYFVRPTVVSDIEDEAMVVGEEQFAPIIPIMAFDSDDEVVARANASIFGLGASVWSGNAEHALHVAGQLEAGTVWVNAHGSEWLLPGIPYGGIKQSGIGRKSGLIGALDYTELQTITIAG